MPDTKVIEVRCKGLFAYLRGKNGERWLAVPKPSPSDDPHEDHAAGHPCLLAIRKKMLVNENEPGFKDATDDEAPESFVIFTESMRGLAIVGATLGPMKDRAKDPIPSNGLADGEAGSDDSWTSQGFIPSLDEFYPPGNVPVADVSKAAFLMSLPANTEWHGLAPRGRDMQKCQFDFINDETKAQVGSRQVITDVVGFHLEVPVKTELQIDTGNSIVTVQVDFTPAGRSPIRLTATPGGLVSGPKLDEPLEHFRHLYHLTDDPERKDVVLPVCRCTGPGVAHAANIFCPGGEGEGEGGG